MMPMTPDVTRKVGIGMMASPSPFLTPRFEKRRGSVRGASEWIPSTKMDKDGGEVNVQVVLRCRPLNEEEQKCNVPMAISCNEQRREVSLVPNVVSKPADRVFTFDKVFGPKSQQRSIYDQAVAPIVNDVLEGFNCTVFAYGQTGTGKTYTMEGDNKKMGGELSADAGVIPRAVRQIFDMLDAQKADYSMKVTFMELYNEEITDLLAPDDQGQGIDERQKKSVSLMEDGKGCVNLRGLEEEVVYSASDIYSLLERGMAKRRITDTLINKRSSRSHVVFSITIHVKESAVGSEDLIKCGKLNLVDLAGSENISRSGATEGRAREAGEINKSLLTLGRVINALVEHSVHIPYRDSKLTRLLRDSLGGKTKTCIVATISPSAHCLDETLSTLNYAFRAKNIRNKPEANQKISKTALLKDLYLEVQIMKEDVRAAREKNGVYIPHERYAQDEAAKKARNEKIEQLEISLDLSEKQANKYRELYLTEQEEKLDIQSELRDCKVNLENNRLALLSLEENYKAATKTIKENELFISKLLQSEDTLVNCAKKLRADLRDATEDITCLFGKIDQKNRIEAENQDIILTFGSQLDQNLNHLNTIIVGSVSWQQQQLRCMEKHTNSFMAKKCDETQILESKIENMLLTHTSGVEALKDLTAALEAKASSDLEQMKTTVLSKTMDVENFLTAASLEAKEIVSSMQSSIKEQKEMLAFASQQQQEGLQRSLEMSQVITNAARDFFNDLQDRACKIKKSVEETQTDKLQKLENFEKHFKEMADTEERLAMEKIGGILAALTARKTTMVSELSKNIQHSSKEDCKQLQQQIMDIQQVSNVAKMEMCKYDAEVEKHFVEDTFAVAETRAVMDNCFDESSTTAEHSRLLWENSCSLMSSFNERSILEIEATVKENIVKNHSLGEEFTIRSSSMVAELKDVSSTALETLKGMLALDQETKQELESISSLCLEEFQCTEEQHRDMTEDVRNQAEQCVTKNYQVDKSPTPSKRIITIPSLTTIEDMRVPVSENPTGYILQNDISNMDQSATKLHQHQHPFAVTPNRAPFAIVNP